ncbi:MAG: hypothetical protein M3384_09765, partial [Acidobacteriota bacterium]|nr:hypothetical protein [Acidobacteriota bacterium]
FSTGKGSFNVLPKQNHGSKPNQKDVKTLSLCAAYPTTPSTTRLSAPHNQDTTFIRAARRRK